MCQYPRHEREMARNGNQRHLADSPLSQHPGQYDCILMRQLCYLDIYKLRTMIDDAERLSGPVWCQPNDSRITPLGRLLRLLHLDELPQLVNVVRGEMSLVGPRPERPELVERLAHTIPHYADRFRVRPGITGLAQIQLPADTSQQSVRKKTELDLHYIHTATARQDLWIVCSTLLKMASLHRPEAHPRPSPHSHLPPAEENRQPQATAPRKKAPATKGATIPEGNINAKAESLQTAGRLRRF